MFVNVNFSKLVICQKLTIMANNSIKKLFTTMGFTETSLIEKANEYNRMLQMKSTLGPMTETAKAAVCLDLAATQLGYGFDRDTAKNFANLGKAAYKNTYNTIEKLLGLDKCISIKELCVQFGVMSVTKTAEELLRTYKECDTLQRDFEHPQYVSAAVYTACQLKQVKVDRSQFQNVSRLKPKQWKELETEFLKFAENKGMKTDGKIKGKKKKESYLADMLNISQDDIPSLNKKEQDKEIINVESYEAWRERILNEAYKELNKTREIV